MVVVVASLLVLLAGAPAESAPSPAPVDETPFESEGSAQSESADRADRAVPKLADRKTAHMLRLHLMYGPAFRIREVDSLLSLGAEYGRMHGFSGAFHTELLPAAPGFGDPVRVTEATLGAGAVLRGRTANRPLFGSIGLTAGIRIHRAHTDTGVLHRVDPDLRLPIQGSWTIRVVGLSVAVVQAYSFRNREYESRGSIVWHRSAYRICLLLGLHFDVVTRGRERGSRKGPATPRARRTR